MKQLPSPRDILLFETEHEGVWASAVDSCGGIGREPQDSLQVDPVIVGMFTARVVLLEIMAVGAKPAFASLAVSNGPDTAACLIEGVKSIFSDDLPLMISTEKNMPTPMTGFGVTVTGFCKGKDLLTGHAKAGDKLYCAGRPLVGAETLKPGAGLFEIKHLENLMKNPHVHAVIPVGSKGITAEAAVLSEESGLACQMKKDPGVDLYQSAGPATCAVFAADAPVELELPVFEIGTLIKP